MTDLNAAERPHNAAQTSLTGEQLKQIAHVRSLLKEPEWEERSGSHFGYKEWDTWCCIGNGRVFFNGEWCWVTGPDCGTAPNPEAAKDALWDKIVSRMAPAFKGPNQ